MAWLKKVYDRCRFWWKIKTAVLEEQILNILSVFHKTDASFPHEIMLCDQAIRTYRNKVVASLVLLLVIAISGFSLFTHKYREKNQLISAYGFKKDIPNPRKIKRGDLKEVYLPQKYLSPSSIQDMDSIVGSMLLFPVSKNEILLQKHINPWVHPDSIGAQFHEYFALQVEVDWFEGGIPQLYSGDHIDILVYKSLAEIQTTETLIEKVRVLVGQEKNKKFVTLNVTKEQAHDLLFARNMQMSLQILLYPASS